VIVVVAAFEGGKVSSLAPASFPKLRRTQNVQDFAERNQNSERGCAYVCEKWTVIEGGGVECVRMRCVAQVTFRQLASSLF